MTKPEEGTADRGGHGTGRSRSAWTAASGETERRPIESDERADACVIGAGIAGLSTAYALASAGRSVVVLEARAIGAGETGRTTAHLASAIDDRYVEIERVHGREGARLAAASHAAAIEEIERVARAEGIDCDLERVDGYLFLDPGTPADLLDRELEAAGRAGVAGVERVERAPVPGCDTGPALRFPRQGQIHPLRFLVGLARAVERAGGRIYGGTRATRVEGGPPALVETDGLAVVRANAVVVATNTPVIDRLAVHTKQAAYRSYAIALRVPGGAGRRALLWDTAEPYHYARLHAAPGAGATGDDWLIVGGEDHKTGKPEGASPEARWDRLETWARRRFPAAAAVERRWSGQVLETVDGLAYIGRNPADAPNVYIATGDSGMGLTHGTIAGLLIRDLIAGVENPWARLYDPARVNVRAAGRWARENLDVAASYGRWLAPAEVASADEVPPGEGAILRRGLRPIAVFRDETGRVHERSAVCPHLGCIVRWNGAEKSWDCPCHGSRFDPIGRVLNGPANGGLPPLPEVRRPAPRRPAPRRPAPPPDPGARPTG